MYKKAWCTCEIVVLLSKPIAFVEFPSPSSDLKVPIGIGQLGTRFSGRCHCREVYTRVNIWTVRRGKKVAVVERWPSVEVRQPKYCYEKTIHVVLNQLCSSLWTSRFWSSVVHYFTFGQMRTGTLEGNPGGFQGQCVFPLVSFDRYANCGRGRLKKCTS